MAKKEIEFKGERADITARVVGFDEAPFGNPKKYGLDLVTKEYGDIIVTGWGETPSWLSKKVNDGEAVLVDIVLDIVQGDKRPFYNIKEVNDHEGPKQADLGEKTSSPGITPTPTQKPPKLPGNEAVMVLLNARIQSLNILAKLDSQQKIDLVLRNADKVTQYLLTGTAPKKNDKKP